MLKHLLQSFLAPQPCPAILTTKRPSKTWLPSTILQSGKQISIMILVSCSNLRPAKLDPLYLPRQGHQSCCQAQEECCHYLLRFSCHDGIRPSVSSGCSVTWTKIVTDCCLAQKKQALLLWTRLASTLVLIIFMLSRPLTKYTRREAR